jgi:hypothetical protein
MILGFWIEKIVAKKWREVMLLAAREIKVFPPKFHESSWMA